MAIMLNYTEDYKKIWEAFELSLAKDNKNKLKGSYDGESYDIATNMKSQKKYWINLKISYKKKIAKVVVMIGKELRESLGEKATSITLVQRNIDEFETIEEMIEFFITSVETFISLHENGLIKSI